MNPVKFLFIFSFLQFLICWRGAEVHAQDNDNQLWVNYAITSPINEKWSYGGDLGMRGLVSNYDWNQILIRPNMKYRFNYTFSISPAIAWLSTINRDAGDVNEFRLHQDFNAKWPDLGFVEFFYRIRVEERFFFYQNPQIKNNFNVRVRGLIGVETADMTFISQKRPIYFQAIYEGFKTIEESALEIFVNQARFHLAFGHRLSEQIRYELHYIRQGSRLFIDSGLGVSQNIYRLRLYHRLPNKT